MVGLFCGSEVHCYFHSSHDLYSLTAGVIVGVVIVVMVLLLVMVVVFVVFAGCLSWEVNDTSVGAHEFLGFEAWPSPPQASKSTLLPPPTSDWGMC